MNKIKEYRLQAHLTQTDLANLMHTTQQTIGRWENGNPEPSIANLRDLGYILRTTVGALVGDAWSLKQTSSVYSMLKDNEEGLDGLWGNFGILPNGKKKSIWYPITLGTYQRIPELVKNDTPFQLETLNNKLVLVNPKHIKRFVALDEAADEFLGDWEIEWNDLGYESLEIYEALEAYYEEEYEIRAKDSLSENLRETIRKFVTDNELNETKILQLTSGIRIFFHDGTTESYILSDFDFIDPILFSIFASDEFPETITINIDEFSMYIPAESIAILEFPLSKVTEVLSRLNPISEEDVK